MSRLVAAIRASLQRVRSDDRLFSRIPGSVVIAGVAIMLSYVVLLFVPNWFDATSRLLVVSSSNTQNSGLAALAAAQLGVGSTQSDPANPQFLLYAATTNAIADSVLTRPLKTTDTTYSAAAHFFVDSGSFSRSHGGARVMLRDRMILLPDIRLPVLQITISTRDPRASFEINKSLIDALGKFVLQNQTNNSRGQREFVERELGKAREQLSAAESELASTMARNRNVTNSPLFNLELARLRRKSDQAAQLEASLTQQLQSARLAEARDTPAIVVLDPPELPRFPTGPKRLLLSILISVLIFGIALFYRPLRLQFGVE